MNRTEFIAVTAAILFVAFLLGWFANWLVHRLTRVSQADLSELDSMAQGIHEAEEARDQAIEYLQQRETDMMNRQHRLEADLRAALDDLRDARAEADELRAYIERRTTRR